MQSRSCFWALLLLMNTTHAAPQALDPALIEYLEQFVDDQEDIFDAQDLQSIELIPKPESAKKSSSQPVLLRPNKEAKP